VGVTHHIALWSPDFPRRNSKLTGLQRGDPGDSSVGGEYGKSLVSGIALVLVLI
jgi:hypothetical protein